MNSHMEDTEFVALAEKVLNAKGTPIETVFQNGHVYEDDIVIIRSNYNGLGLEIERKAQNDPDNPHLKVSNPVTMVDPKGVIIRHHGEYIYLTDHLKALAEAVITPDLEMPPQP